jgi:hypothetical protein
LTAVCFLDILEEEKMLSSRCHFTINAWADDFVTLTLEEDFSSGILRKSVVVRRGSEPYKELQQLTEKLEALVFEERYLENPAAGL